MTQPPLDRSIASVVIMQMYRQAEEFRSAAEILDREMCSREVDKSTFGYLSLPAIVLSALATELFFKAIKLFDSNVLDQKQHDLKKLFEDQSAESMDAIQSLWIEDTRLDGQEFRDTLEEISNAFVKFRYVHEWKQDKEHRWDGGSVLKAVRQRLLDLQPHLLQPPEIIRG